MAVHVAHLTSTIRWYNADDGQAAYDGRADYEVVATLQWLAGGLVEISAMHGTFRPAYWREIRDYLIGAGVTSVRLERDGKVHRIWPRGRRR